MCDFGCGGSTNTSTSTSSTQVPEWLSNAGQNIFDRARNIADRGYTPYNGDTVAGMSGLQTEAMDQAGMARDSYMGSNRTGTADAYFRAFGETPAQQINGQYYYDNRSSINPSQFGRTAGYDAQQFATPTQIAGSYGKSGTINPGQFSNGSQINGNFGQVGSVDAGAQLGGQRLNSNAYGMGTGVDTERWMNDRSTIDSTPYGQSAGSVTAGQVNLTDTTSGMLAANDANPFRSQTQYMNPFIEGAMEPTLRRIREQGGVARNAIGAQAIGSGAFGDARHGVVEADQFDDEQRAVGDYASQMLMQGYDRATAERESAINRYTGAYTGDIDRRVGVDTGNVNRDLQAGMFNVGQTQAARQLQLQAEQANAALREAAMNRTMQGQQFNANLGEAATNRRFQADTANMGAGEQALARFLQGQTTNASLAENAQNRLLQQATSNANLQDNAMQRYLSALQYDTNLSESAMNRSFQQAQQNAGFQESAQNRLQSGLQYNAGLDEAAANRQLTATQADANLREAALSRQFGAEDANARFNEASLQRLLTGGQQLSALDSTAIQQQTALSNLLATRGSEEQAQQQRIMSDAYQRFLEQRDYPQASLNVLINALRAQPNQSTTTQINQTPNNSNILATLAGAGINAWAGGF